MYVGLDYERAAVGILSLYAASALGTLGGFLFGIPKANSEMHSTGRSRRNLFLPNTNSEQVSDWLTKIIVSVGLIQFRQIGAALGAVGAAVGAAIQRPQDAPTQARCLLSACS
jgi:hypothetical protein